jgi:hypothetical protein
MFDVERSVFDVHQFLFRFDWTLTASGGAHMKLQRFNAKINSERPPLSPKQVV